jgi:uncharacterized MAPEG superfamily protein
MSGIDGIIYLILIACLLPYVFTIIAKASGGFKAADNQNAILMAEYMVVSQHLIMMLGIAYIVLRIIYGICYLANISALRTIIWALSLACPIILLLLVIRIV